MELNAWLNRASDSRPPLSLLPTGVDTNTIIDPVNSEHSQVESEDTLVDLKDAPNKLEDGPIESKDVPIESKDSPKESLAGTSGDVENYYCGTCSLWIHDFNALEHHVRSSAAHTVPARKPSFMCAICRGKFPTAETLYKHIDNPPWNSVMHRTWEEVSYAARYDDEWQWQWQDRAIQDGLLCHPCNRLFINQDSLDQHLASSTAHKDNLPAKCDSCGILFCDATALAQHLKSSQAHRKRYYCSPCGFEFGDETALAQHSRDSKAHRMARNPNPT